MNGAGAPVEMVGRATELTAVADALAALDAGASRTLLVSGEAGIGKSALLEETAARAGRTGALVLRGRGAEQEGEVPFGLAIDVLDDRVRELGDPAALAPPELAAVLPSLAGAPEQADTTTAAQRFRFHRALRAFVDELAGHRAVVLVLDDLHWADEASLEWVMHLLRRPLRRPHLLVLGMRPVGPHGRMLEALRATAAWQHLELAPLAGEHAEALLAHVGDPGRRRALAAEAGGNPLFLLELGRLPGHVEQLPATVMAAIGLEVDGLDVRARGLLQAAAVVGDPFEAGLAAIAADLGPHPPELDALVRSGLVRAAPGGRTLRFRHPLIRRAVYDAAPIAARHAAHLRVADALRERGEPASAFARHLERTVAVGDERGVATLEAAAAQAMARSPLTAARWLRLATDLRRGAPAHEQARRLSRVAVALLVGGRPAEAHDALMEAIDGLGDDPIDELRLQLVAATADIQLLLGRPEAAQRRVREALEALDEATDPTIRARLTYWLAMSAGHRSEEQEFFALAGTAADVLERVDPATAVSDRAISVHAALWVGEHDLMARREVVAREAWEQLDRSVLRERPDVAFYVGQFLTLTQHNREAIAVAEEGLAAVRASGNDGALVNLLVLHLQALYLDGDVRRARAALAVCEEASHLQGALFGVAYAAAVRVALARLDGDGPDTARALESWAQLRPHVAHDGIRRIGDCHVARLVAETDPARGARLVREATGEDLSVGDFDMTTRLIPVVVAADLAAADRTSAEAATRIVEERARASGLPVTQAAALVARAEIGLAAGDPAAAADAAGRAGALIAPHGYLELRFHADLLQGRALAALGRRGEAIDVLRASAERAQDLGAWTLAEAAARELRRLGSRLPTVLRVRSEEGELTDREAQIADMVAAGRSNREVGALLFLSPKTVEHALTRVYAKLGVRSRTELAGALASRSTAAALPPVR